MAKQVKALTITLKSYPNVDRGQTRAPARSKKVSANTLVEIRKAFIAYRDENDLGAGNFGQCEINHFGVPFARISYNGRLWLLSNNSEIIIDEE